MSHSTTNRGAEHWDKRYERADYLFGTEPNDFLKQVTGTIPAGSNTLCLADGEGRNGVYLAGLGHKVTSIDQSAAGLAKADQLAADHGVSLTTIQADLTQYDLGAREWDCIVSIFFHLPPELKDVIYPKVISALAPGGLLILESYRPEQLGYGTGGPPVVENMLTKAEISTRFSALSTTHLIALERDVIEGSGHTGTAAVVQYIGTAQGNQV